MLEENRERERVSQNSIITALEITRHIKGENMDYTKMNLTDTTSTYKPPVKRCELCTHYGMIDSGYGRCKRYPPILTYVRFLRIEYKYPEVAWCENGCGEFDKKIK